MISVIRFYCLFVFFICISSQTGIAQEYQNFDGTNNNKSILSGSNGANLLRVTDVSYADGISEAGGLNRLNPRQISNIIFKQEESILDQLNLSDFVWVFGQFVEHDITYIEDSFDEDASIDILAGDEYFAEGSQIQMFRSLAAEGTGTSTENPRQHSNLVTAFVDGSAIYGSDELRAQWLRSGIDGKLKVSRGNLLPWNTDSFEFNGTKDANAPFMANESGTDTKLFVAGDLRANENPLLISMHTLFVREHNRLCDQFKLEDLTLTDEQLFLNARRHVSAYLQNIVFNEWLPSMGVNLPTYNGYQDEIESGIFNVFSSAAFRHRHTLVSRNIIRLNEEGESLPRGHITLRDAFFNPAVVLIADGIHPYLQGMATQVQQELDYRMIDDVRNFQLIPGIGNGIDQAAININRGRERGLPDYNTVRTNFGLPSVNSFEDITEDVSEANLLASVYTSVDDIDPWVGLLAEYHMPNALFGQTILLIMNRQFQLLRDGDRFYFENDPLFSEDEKELIRNTSFKDLITRNTPINLMQDNVFEALAYNNIPTGPEIEEVQLAAEVYPNPTTDVFTLKVFAEDNSDMALRIIDNNGRTILKDFQSLVEGNNFFSYDVKDRLGKGLFNVVLEQGVNIRVMKLIVD